jgi:drug/metabolite transporter (DMT)-like permease
MRISRRVVGDVALLVLVNTMWAAQYAAYKTATARMGPVTVSTWAFLIAAVTLLPFLARERRASSAAGGSASPPDGPEGPDRPDRQVRQSPWTIRNLADFLVLGILGLVPASVLLAWGTDRSTASNAALIYLTIPIITALLASVMVHEKMTAVRWASLVVALAGVLILSDFDWRHLGLASGKYAFANFLILLACASSSFYNVFCKKLLGRFTPFEVLVYGYLCAVIASVPLLVWVEPFRWSEVQTYNAATWIALLVLSVVSWGLAMVLWMYLLTRLDVSQASVSVYLLPFLGVLISSLTLRERITSTMILGGAVTLVGTILVTSTETTSES